MPIRLLDITDYAKGALLENQGDSSMQQYFTLDGILKRMVSNAACEEMMEPVAFVAHPSAG